MDHFDETLQHIWPAVRRKHLFPELPMPVFNEADGGVNLEVRSKKILVSKPFVAAMAGEIAPAKVMEALADHAVAHHLYCPWNLATHLILYAEARKVLDNPQAARLAADAFMDVAADTRCVGRIPTPIPELYRHLRGGILWQVQKALCQRLWRMDLQAPGYSDIARKLAFIPYLDRHAWGKGVKRFAMLLKPFLETAPDDDQTPAPMGPHGFRGYTPEEISHGLRELAGAVSGPEAFNQIVGEFAQELACALEGHREGAGLGLGREEQGDVLYYMKLAENYRLPVVKRQTEGSGGAYPHHHLPWEAGQPVRDIDPWTSMGKILPGITQTWKREHGPIFGGARHTPDCVLIIDSSSSMVNPLQHLSHAVLGAGCACDAYLRLGARVAVYNFGDAQAGGSFVLPLGRSRRNVFESLCLYHGGGTRLGIEQAQNLLGDGLPDIFLITDMQITNLAELLTWLNRCTNRVTAVHLGENDEVLRFRDSTGLRPEMGLFAVKQTEDISRIIIGQVRDYFLGTGRKKK